MSLEGLSLFIVFADVRPADAEGVKKGDDRPGKAGPVVPSSRVFAQSQVPSPPSAVAFANPSGSWIPSPESSRKSQGLPFAFASS